MKSFKTLFPLFAILGMIVVLTPACNKDIEGCTDPDAENFNNEANVSTNTCIFPRDKFIGAYEVDEDCISTYYSDESYDYNITIVEDPTNDKRVIIQNFYDVGEDVPALINGSNFTIDYTDIDVIIQGSGTLSGNTLNFSYDIEVYNYSSYYPDDILECEAVGIKQ